MVVERKATEAIMRWIKSQPDAHVVKVWQGAMTGSGEPDLSFCIAGRRGDVEVKKPGLKARPKQKFKLRQWAKAGSITGVVTSLDEFLDLLEQHGVTGRRS